MTTLLVNINDEHEEKMLTEFLDSNKFDYSREGDMISAAQQEEILQRERAFKEGKIKSQPWEEVRKRFLKA
jgi:hypothetical protein